MSGSELPLPPLELATRVGSITGENQLEQYQAIGSLLKLGILNALPGDWDWSDRRILDFGCGAGRVLRHFTAEAAAAEFWGCDIDIPSIEWLRAHLCPPFRAFVVGEDPGLPQDDEFFDLVWTLSVFTHLTDNWAAWLLEMHRVLRPGGYLIATFAGANMGDLLLDEPWQEDRIGMNVLGAGRPWSEGGPFVFHSEWWLRAHWGRAFEIARLDTNTEHPGTHGVIVLRKKEVHPTVAELEQPEPEEPRELFAARHNIAQLHAEDRRLRQQKSISDRRARQLETRFVHRWAARARTRLHASRSGR